MKSAFTFAFELHTRLSQVIFSLSVNEIHKIVFFLFFFPPTAASSPWLRRSWTRRPIREGNQRPQSAQAWASARGGAFSGAGAGLVTGFGDAPFQLDWKQNQRAG